MADNKFSLSNIINKIKGNKKLQNILIVLLAICAVVILFFSYNSEKTTSNSQGGIAEYVLDLESRLSSVLSDVDGAGKVSVVITVESGMETVLAMTTTEKQTANGIETQTTPVIINGKTVVLKENYPKIVGVLIVAQGADKISVKNKIQQATQSLLNINLNQIEILSMK